MRPREVYTWGKLLAWCLAPCSRSDKCYFQKKGNWGLGPLSARFWGPGCLREEPRAGSPWEHAPHSPPVFSPAYGGREQRAVPDPPLPGPAGSQDSLHQPSSSLAQADPKKLPGTHLRSLWAEVPSSRRGAAQATRAPRSQGSLQLRTARVRACWL